jgi:SNF2 family DNA or RNA helicase
MAMTNRTKAIEAFQQDPPTTVFILTLRSAACGINLTAASHIFMLEPCMNPAVEAQAIGRAWRMGQTRNVVVKRLYVKVGIGVCLQGVVKVLCLLSVYLGRLS